MKFREYYEIGTKAYTNHTKKVTPGQKKTIKAGTCEDKDPAEYDQEGKMSKRQLERMKEIEKTMKDSTVLQRQIPPLARRMFEGLRQFVSLDIPFRAGERTERLSFIQAALDNPVVSPAEKLRQVLDGYSVESEYGRKIDTYKVTILRIK